MNTRIRLERWSKLILQFCGKEVISTRRPFQNWCATKSPPYGRPQSCTSQKGIEVPRMKIGLHQMATRNSSSGYWWQMKLREKHTLSNIPNGEWWALIWRRCQICEKGQENSKINHLNKPPSSMTSLIISNFQMGWNWKLNK